MTLGQNNRRQRFGLDSQLLLARSVAGMQVLEDAAVRFVGHGVEEEGKRQKWEVK